MSKDSKFRITIETLMQATGIKAAINGFEGLADKLGKVKAAGEKAFSVLKSGLNLLTMPLQIAGKGLAWLTAGLAGAVVEGSKFNVQMARVWTMAGGGISNFRALREEARALASEFGIARAEIANGMYNALSAGVDRNALTEFMQTAAKVAVADGSDISVAVDGITTVLNAFGMKASETEAVVDLLFQTVRQGKTTFEELAANLSNTASTAAAANIPLAQILAHIATLTAQGTPTAQATTQIRASIIGLNKALGDGWSATMSYQEALKKVWDQAGGSQTKLLELVGSTEAMSAVIGGVGRNADIAAQKLGSMAQAAGSANVAFNEVQQFRHWKVALESSRSALSKLGDEMDQRLAPAIRYISSKFREWTENKSFWDAVGQKLNEAADSIGAAFITARDAAAVIRDHLAKSGEGFGTVLNSFLTNGVKSFTDAFIAALQASVAIWKLFGTVVASAIKEELLKLDLPGMRGMRERAAKDAVTGMSQDTAERYLLETGRASQEAIDYLKKIGTDLRDVIFGEINSGRMPVAEQASLAASIDGAATEKAMSAFRKAIEATTATLMASLAGNLDKTVTDATGKPFDSSAEYQRNKQGIEQQRLDRQAAESAAVIEGFQKPASPPAAPAATPADPAALQAAQTQAAEAMKKAAEALAAAEKDSRSVKARFGSPEEKAAAKAALDAAQAKAEAVRKLAEELKTATGEQLARLVAAIQQLLTPAAAKTAEDQKTAAADQKEAAADQKEAAETQKSAATTQPGAAGSPPGAAPDSPSEKEAYDKGHRKGLMGDYYSPDFRSPWAPHPDAAPRTSPRGQEQGGGGADRTAEAMGGVTDSVNSATQALAQQIAQLNGAVANLSGTLVPALGGIVSAINQLASQVAGIASQVANLASQISNMRV